MNLLDSRLTLYFEKLFIPIIENQEFVIDLKYEEDHYRFKYPMENPHIMPIKDPFTREKNVINMIVMIRVGKKYRKIAKAEINLYKKYFLTEKLGVDKWVHLELLETQLEQMGHNTNILKTVINTGKIYMKSQLIDPEIAEVSGGKSAYCDNMTIYSSTTQATAITQMLKNNLRNISNTKEKTATTRTEKYRSITEHTNEFLKNLKNRKMYSEEELFEDIVEDDEEKREEFNDNVSDFSVSIIDGKEEKHEEINQANLEIEFLIDRVKKEFYDRFDNLLPEDPKEIKFFLQNISSFIFAIANSYTENLKAMAEVTKKIRAQAQDYYEKYKTLNKDFLKKRRELKSKTESLNEKNKLNLEENEKTQKNLEEFDFEYKYFKERMNIEISQDKEDINNMAAVLDSLVQDVNIFEGLEEDDALLVSEALNDYLQENKDSNPDYDRECQDINLFTEKIKMIVDDLYERRKISLIDIKYLENRVVCFGKKCVCLILKDDVIYVNAAKENIILSDWLIENFPYTEKEDVKTENKVVLTSQNYKSSPTKKDTLNSARMNTANTPKVKSNIFNSLNDKKVSEKKPTIKNEKVAKITKNNAVVKK